MRITTLKYVPLFSICGPNVTSRQNLQNSEKKTRKQSQPFKRDAHSPFHNLFANLSGAGKTQFSNIRVVRQPLTNQRP